MVWAYPYRWIQIDKDGSGNIFAAASFGEEGLERTALVYLLALLGVETAICTETVLKEIPK